MNNFLAEIKNQTLQRVSLLPEIDTDRYNNLDFCASLQSKPGIIAEIKFARPCHGRIYPGALSASHIAEEYLKNGAGAISVLTEATYFQGDIKYLNQIRNVLPQAPLLMKDFILSEKQILQGLLHGANAILLIVAFLEPDRLKTLYHYALSRGLTPLLEVHNKAELDLALSFSPKLIGINNRNLDTLSIDLDTSRTLIEHIPESCLTICESGIQHRAQIKEMQALGFDGFLIGSHLMHHEHPGEALHALL